MPFPERFGYDIHPASLGIGYKKQEITMKEYERRGKCTEDQGSCFSFSVQAIYVICHLRTQERNFDFAQIQLGVESGHFCT